MITFSFVTATAPFAYLDRKTNPGQDHSMTCGKGTESGDLVCPPASHPRAIRPNAVGAGKVDFSGGISQEPVPANFRMPDDTSEASRGLSMRLLK
jgi:hypothetical protein